MALTLEAQQVAVVIDSVDEETRAYLRDMVFRVAGRALPEPSGAHDERERVGTAAPALSGPPTLRIV